MQCECKMAINACSPLTVSSNNFKALVSLRGCAADALPAAATLVTILHARMSTGGYHTTRLHNTLLVGCGDDSLEPPELQTACWLQAGEVFKGKPDEIVLIFDVIVGLACIHVNADTECNIGMQLTVRKAAA